MQNGLPDWSGVSMYVACVVVLNDSQGYGSSGGWATLVARAVVHSVYVVNVLSSGV